MTGPFRNAEISKPGTGRSPNILDMTTSETSPTPTVWPALHALDAPALVEFLVDTVGFRQTAVYAEGDQIHHVQLDWPEGGGVMLGSHQPDSVFHRPPGTAAMYVVTDRVDALYERLRQSAATVVRELGDRDYGSREFTIADPEGNLWSFGTYRGEPTS